MGAFYNVTTRADVNNNFKLNPALEQRVKENLKALNNSPKHKEKKWIKVRYSSSMKETYGVPFKKNIGRYEIAIMPETHIFIKADYKLHFPAIMVEELSDAVAKGYGLDVGETEKEAEPVEKKIGRPAQNK